MTLTPNQIQELVDIIEYTHLVFIGENIGLSVLSDYDKKVLQEAGFDFSKINTDTLTVEQAFKFGILAQSITIAETFKLDYNQLKKHLKATKAIPLSYEEQQSLQSVKYQAYKDIKGLGNKISNDLQSIIINADQKQRSQYQKIIQQEAQRAVRHRLSISEMVSNLGHRTGDWNRDFGRISDYILHNAFEHGVAAGIKKEHGLNAKVYKDVYPGACKHCLRLYLTDGIGSPPKIFLLSELESNGTNIGRKAKEYLPVLGPTHPWCRCTTVHYDERYEFNPKTRHYDILKKDLPTKVKRSSKVKVTVGDETTFV